MSDKIFLSNGFYYITNAITTALSNNKRTITITENFEIDNAIIIPSDFTIILDGCHLKMSDNCYSNMFVNEHHGMEIGKTLKGTDRNISIIGRNGAIIDGGKYNGLSEKNHNENGLPPIWKNNLVLFTNVDGFEISGISFHNQRWWALNFIYCCNGKLRNINFKANDIWLDDNGNEHHGLQITNYEGILVKNADGIDLRQGCHDILIENITGFTEDDTIALTGLNGLLEQTFRVKERCSDIYNVTIKNVKSSALCSNVRLLNQGGLKLHDILIEDVYDVSMESPYMDRGAYSVRVGDEHLYGECHPNKEETYNITINNVHSRGVCAAISLVGEMNNIIVDNIHCIDNTIALEDKRIL